MKLKRKRPQPNPDITAFDKKGAFLKLFFLRDNLEITLKTITHQKYEVKYNIHVICVSCSKNRNGVGPLYS
jgi:hypothetical protein